MLSCVQLFVTLWTVAGQTPLSMGFSRQEYWSGLPLPPPRDLPDPEIKPMFPAVAGRFGVYRYIYIHIYMCVYIYMYIYIYNITIYAI